MNRLNTLGFTRQSRDLDKSEPTSMSLRDRPEIDQRERALSHRLELAKQRLVLDLGQLSSLLGAGAGEVKKGFVRASFVVGGLLLLGLVTVLARRRRRFRWRFF
jgi:hypothetical protein